MLSVLALDLATSTGWALRDRDGNVTSGVQRFDLARGESPGMRFLRFRRWLLEIKGLAVGCSCRVGGHCRCHPAVIAFERAHHRGGAATQLAAGLQAIVLEEAARVESETLPVHTATLKKHATGKGNAKKPDMVKAALDRWSKHVGPRDASGIGEDEADALCVLAWALDELEGVAAGKDMDA